MLKSCVRFLVLSVAIFCLPLFASTHTWTGPANGLWSNSGNWTGGAPTSNEPGGTIVVFSANSTSTMDIVGLIVDQIHFTGTNNLVKGTTSLSISGSVLTNNIVDDVGGNKLDSTMPTIISGTVNIFVQVNAGQLTIASNISGNRGIRFTSSGANGATITSAANTYLGSTTVASGTLTLNSGGFNTAIPGTLVIGTGANTPAAVVLAQSLEIADSSDVTVNSDGTLSIANFNETVGNLSVFGGSVTFGTTDFNVSGTLNISGGTISSSGGALLNLGGDVTAASLNGTGATISCKIGLNGNRKFTVTGGVNTDLNLSNAISNGGNNLTARSLTKEGNGILLMSTGAANAYTGGTFVNAGKLTLNGGSSSVIPGTLTIGAGTGAAASATVQVLQNSEIVNTAAVTVNSDGVFDLNGLFEQFAFLTINSGSVTIGAGSLTITSNAANALVMNGGTATATTGSIVLSGGIQATSSASGSAMITSKIALAAGAHTLDVSAGTAPELMINGVVSEAAAASLVKTGAGTLRLSGTNNNTFTGTTTVSAGVLELNQTVGNTIPAGGLIIGNNIDPAGNAIVREINSSDINSTAPITINSSGVLDLNLHSDLTGMLSGSGSVSLPGASTLTVNNDNGTSAFSGSISGMGTFRKSGTGTLTLTGNNPLSGRITVNDGTLALNGAAPNTVVQAATLQVGDGLGNANTAVLSLGANEQIADTTALDVRLDGNFAGNNFAETIGAASVDRGSVDFGTGSLSVASVAMSDGTIGSSTSTLKLRGDVTASFVTAGAVISAQIELNGTRTITTNTNSTPTLTMSGVVKDGTTPSGIVKIGVGTLRFTSTQNTFTGASTILAGITELKCSSFTAFSGPLTIGNNTDPAGTAVVRNLIQSNLANTVALTINSSGQLDLNNFFDKCGTLNGSGSVTLGSGTLTASPNSLCEFSGVISGTGAVSKSGTSVLTLSGTNTYTGTTQIISGDLRVNGKLPGAVNVQATGTLSGKGSVGTLNVAGIVAPFGGPLSSGNTTFNATGVFVPTINSASPGLNASLAVTGTVNITAGATLTASLAAGAAIPKNAKLVLIDNDSNDAITGAFANAAAAGTVTVSGLPLTVAYNGGTGNDFELTAQNVAPQIQAASATPSPASAAQSVSFSATVSDVNNDPLTYAWDFGDGTQGSGATPTHTYSQLGVLTVTLVVSDGQSGTATTSFTITIVNDAPKIVSAKATPSPANAGEVVQFSATATDANNDALTYAWDFGDSTQGSGASPSHTYSKSGALTVKLTVSDGKGGTTTNSFGLTINNVAPTITSAASANPSIAGVGQNIAFLVGATDINNDTLTFSWDFGDTSNGSGPSVSHMYTAAGIFTATVSVSDGVAPAVTSSVMVTVNAPIVGTGLDSDGDGFSDQFEASVGTSAQNPNDTPTGGTPAAPPLPLVIGSTTIKLNFSSKPNQDSIVFSGTLKVAAGFVAKDQKVSIDVGGVAKSFTLDAKGIGGDKTNSFKLGVKSNKGVVATQTAKYQVSLKNGAFAAQLADEGLTNADDAGSAKNVLITVVFDKGIYQMSKALKYKAKKGKGGTASGK